MLCIWTANMTTSGVRDAYVSRHHGGEIKGPLKPLNIAALWYRGV